MLTLSISQTDCTFVFCIVSSAFSEFSTFKLETAVRRFRVITFVFLYLRLCSVTLSSFVSVLDGITCTNNPKSSFCTFVFLYLNESMKRSWRCLLSCRCWTEQFILRSSWYMAGAYAVISCCSASSLAIRYQYHFPPSFTRCRITALACTRPVGLSVPAFAEHLLSMTITVQRSVSSEASSFST